MTLFWERACVTLVSYLQPLVTLQLLTPLGKFLSFIHLRKSHHLFIQNCGTGIVVLEETLKSPLDCKEVKPANPQGNQPWISIGRADAEAETPILWLPDVKSRLIGKDPDAGEDWRQKEKRAAEDEMLGCITDSMDINLNKLQETVKDRGAWPAEVHRVT